MSNRVSHQEIVRKLLETKSIDFNAIGKTVAEIGPSVALADEPWDMFCGTMRTFLRLYILNPGIPGGGVENLGGLRNVAQELER
ncbi:hypothetical protein [Rhodanobacter sp. B04]|uniref:hypothetical protein n=1 Tax=Rhodanobacter sp. B04 TaxID=1945860 RepID=UPI0011159710|nr:hypothetical protein [Rhodanobacter sp. B04]